MLVIKNGVWTEIGGGHKELAIEKPEGGAIPFANPKCYVPINEPNAAWWEQVKESESLDDIYGDLNGAVAGRVHDVVGRGAIAPTMEPYRSYVWAVSVSQEQLEDVEGVHEKAKLYVMRAMVNTVRWCVESEPEKILYWRRLPEATWVDSDYGLTRAYRGYMRFVMGVRV